jgi:choline kinase
MSRAVRNIKELVVKTDQYSVIILASSHSVRMKSHGTRSLLQITEKACLIDKQIEYVRHVLPGAEIVLVTGFESDKIMNKTPHDVIKVENETYTELETVRDLGIGLRAATKNHVVFLPGHLAFQRDLLKSVCQKSSIVLSENINETLNVGCCVNDFVVENLHFDLPNKWTGCAVISGNELDLLRTFCWNRSKDKLLLFEALNHVINKGGKLTAKYTPVKVVSIEIPQELDTVRRILK